MKKKRKADPLAGKRYNPLGTKKQSEQHQRTRELKNKILELENDKKALLAALDNFKGREVEYLRRLAVRTPGRQLMDAVNSICALPYETAHRGGISFAVRELVIWRDGLVDRPVEDLSYARAIELATGNVSEVSDKLSRSDKITQDVEAGTLMTTFTPIRRR